MKRVVILSCALLSFPALAQELSHQRDASPSEAGGWRYGSEGSGDARRVFATVPGQGQLDGGAPVELTFSHSDLSGRQARVTGLPDSLDCPAACQVELSIDGATDKGRASMPPNSDSTLSLRNARALWKALEGAQRLEIIYPDTGGSDGRAIFEVQGIDLTAMRGW